MQGCFSCDAIQAFVYIKDMLPGTYMLHGIQIFQSIARPQFAGAAYPLTSPPGVQARRAELRDSVFRVSF